MRKSVYHKILLAFALFLFHGISSGQDALNKEWAIKFTSYQTKLSKDVRATVDSIAAKMKANPNISYLLTSYCLSCKNSRYNQVRWDRVNNIITYLIKNKGISPDRLVGRSGIDGGNCDTIEFSVTDEHPNAVAPPPHLNLRKKADQLP